MLLRGLARALAWSWGWLVRGFISSRVQKNAKKVQKNAKLFAYMEFFLYLCIGIGNSPGRNYLTL